MKLKQIKITSPPVVQVYITESMVQYRPLFELLIKAGLYAGAVGIAKYDEPADPHAYSRWYWFSKAARHLWKYCRGHRYDTEGQHHLGAVAFAIAMLLVKTEGSE